MSHARRLAVCLLFASAATVFSGAFLPGWARESPRYFVRDGRLWASAVGSARAENPALARSAAGERARAGLLRLLQGRSSPESAEGLLSGARVAAAFTSADGQVYVRVEVPAEAER